MEIKEAKSILKKHNTWRRGGSGSHGNVKEIGIATDTLTEAPEYGDIATELREAAIAWPSYVSDESSDIALAFIGYQESYRWERFAPKGCSKNIEWRTFMLLVAEAITR